MLFLRFDEFTIILKLGKNIIEEWKWPLTFEWEFISSKAKTLLEIKQKPSLSHPRVKMTDSTSSQSLMLKCSLRWTTDRDWNPNSWWRGLKTLSALLNPFMIGIYPNEISSSSLKAANTIIKKIHVKIMSQTQMHMWRMQEGCGWCWDDEHQSCKDLKITSEWIGEFSSSCQTWGNKKLFM